MSALEHDKIRQTVHERYGRIAQNDGCGCDPTCCGGSTSSANDAWEPNIPVTDYVVSATIEAVKSER